LYSTLKTKVTDVGKKSSPQSRRYGIWLSNALGGNKLPAAAGAGNDRLSYQL